MSGPTQFDFDQTTPVLGLTKPAVGASDDTWGVKLNANMDIIDTVGTVNLTQATQIASNTSAIAANASAIATKVGEAPNDGLQYARKSAGWVSIPKITVSS